MNIALQLAFEAGKCAGQVELEEHYDREQYSSVVLESLQSRNISMPTSKESTGNTVTINLRSQKWRDGVKKSAQEYLDKAEILLNSLPR
jgi:hypothetical protein